MQGRHEQLAVVLTSDQDSHSELYKSSGSSHHCSLKHRFNPTPYYSHGLVIHGPTPWNMPRPTGGPHSQTVPPSGEQQGSATPTLWAREVGGAGASRSNKAANTTFSFFGPQAMYGVPVKSRAEGIQRKRAALTERSSRITDNKGTHFILGFDQPPALSEKVRIIICGIVCVYSCIVTSPTHTHTHTHTRTDG